jgi:hypothetical protein
MEKIKIEKGDVILMRSKDETVECMLVLDRMQEGIKVLINSSVRTYKTEDFFFDQDAVFSLRSFVQPEA